MNGMPEAVSPLLELLAQAPRRIGRATHGMPTPRLYHRSDAEPWSVHDVLAHLRACADMWGGCILAIVAQDTPTFRSRSPRSLMQRPAYRDLAFEVALDRFTEHRQTLVATLTDLDGADWRRRATLIGASPRQQDQTVLRYAERIVAHEQPHLDQIEALLR